MKFLTKDEVKQALLNGECIRKDSWSTKEFVRYNDAEEIIDENEEIVEDNIVLFFNECGTEGYYVNSYNNTALPTIQKVQDTVTKFTSVGISDGVFNCNDIQILIDELNEKA